MLLPTANFVKVDFLCRQVQRTERCVESRQRVRLPRLHSAHAVSDALRVLHACMRCAGVRACVRGTRTYLFGKVVK